MSGYVTRLLRRSFDSSVAAVEPRLNTLFSPPEKISSRPAPTLEDQPAESLPAHTSPEDFETNANTAAVVVTDRSTQTPLAAGEPAPLHSPHSAALASRPSTKTNHLEKNNDAANSHSGPAPSHGISEMPEAVDPVQTPASKGGRESKALPLVTRRQHEKRIVARSTPPVRPEAEVATFDHEGESFADREGLPSRIDQGFPPSSLPLSPKQISGSSMLSERVHAADAARPTQGDARDSLRGKREATPSKTKTHNFVPATPVRGLEESEVARADNFVFEPAASPERRSAEFNFEPPPFFPFPAQSRERERRELKLSRSAEPTIEVTIGRIEVKGAASPQPQRGSSQLSKGPNLEEYLRRRSGRSRE